jgi:ABC-type lipoprotein export system ATPase subunit
MLKKEQQQRAQVLSLSLSLTHHPNAAPQETKKGQKQVVNAFDALQSDDSDEEA